MKDMGGLIGIGLLLLAVYLIVSKKSTASVPAMLPESSYPKLTEPSDSVPIEIPASLLPPPEQGTTSRQEPESKIPELIQQRRF